MEAGMSKKLFLSTVSSEFLAYRELLTDDLKRPHLDVAVQEDFIVTGGSTLEKIDDYIRACHGIIHLIGKATGAIPPEPAVKALLARHADFTAKLPPLAAHLAKPQPGFSYTQWEAYLAIYHQRPLFVYRPEDFELDALHVPRNPGFVANPAEVQSQKDHYRRIAALGRDRGQFLNEERLSSAVLRDLVEILPRLETGIDVPPTKLRHTAERLIGRDEDLARLDAAWNDSHKNVVIVRAFGGMGKTSLVATWMAELALKNWRGAERVFDWSFYSQGTNDQRAASADSFIAAALAAFGDPDPTAGSAWDRGARLAHLVGKVRCLLVLDGLEPLQYPPGPMEGKLKDPAIEALLKGLAAQNAGLCVVTTREKVPDIQQYYGRTADDIPLTALTDLAGAALLHHHGATRAGAQEIKPDDRELRAASREVRGHGLTLQLLGQYLRLVEDGDILKRGTVRLADADHEYQNDATRPYGHAFKAMEAYEKWFQREGERGQRQLAGLRLLGLFDRPASKDCLDALRQEPVIAGLTEPLVGLSSRDWTLVTRRLEEINLLTVQADGALDAHPLLREYFAMRLKEGSAAAPPAVSGASAGNIAPTTGASANPIPDAARAGDQSSAGARTTAGEGARATQTSPAWRAAHRRLYEHLCATTKEGDQPTLEDLQPLYQAVAHGCQAGLQQEAWNKVHVGRIWRGDEYYSQNKLGAFGSELGAMASYFERQWSVVSPHLSLHEQALLLADTGFTLRAVGRLFEALVPMRAGMEGLARHEDWPQAAASASNLSELELTLGLVSVAVEDAKTSVVYGDQSDVRFWQVSNRATLADALQKLGYASDSLELFRETELLLAAGQSDGLLLDGLAGFQYCDLLLAEIEREAWRVTLGRQPQTENSPVESSAELTRGDSDQNEIGSKGSCSTLREVEQRATRALAIAERGDRLLHIALYHLTLTWVHLYEDIVPLAGNQNDSVHFLEKLRKAPPADAADGLRRAGQQTMLPRGLLTRAWQRSLTGARTGPESAQGDLDEAWEIAGRGPMPLFMADIHLYRARLFGVRSSECGVRSEEATPYPWNRNPDGSPRGAEDDLAEARRLIVKHGYLRRMPELEDAEAWLRS
jgi:hypothetical protein